MVPNCSHGHDASNGIERDLPRSNFEVDLSRALSTMLLLMASGDLNIGLTKKSYLPKLWEIQRAIKCRSSFVAIRFVGFQDLKRFRKGTRPIPSLSEPAGNRTKLLLFLHEVVTMLNNDVILSWN